MIGLTIIITGDKKVNQKLKRLGSSLYNFKAPMAKIGKEAADYYSTKGFASQGGVFGKKWKPLSSLTLVARGLNVELKDSKEASFAEFIINKRSQSKSGGLLGSSGNQPLIDTGKMQDSFTYSASSKQVVIGNKMKYFKYHQSTAPRKRLPRRATMGINDPIRNMVKSIIEDDVRNKIRSA